MPEGPQLDRRRGLDGRAAQAHRPWTLSSTEKRLCYCSCVRVVIRMLVASAIVALVLACVTFDPFSPLSAVDDGRDEAPPSLDISIVLPATQIEPSDLPSISGSVFFDDRPPISRVTTAEVFRPPRVRA
jgi:hypothetical protein